MTKFLNGIKPNIFFTQVTSHSFAFDEEASLVIVPIESCSTGFAYLWNETPVLGTEALTIYADNAFHLPAAPWKSPVQMRRTVEIVI